MRLFTGLDLSEESRELLERLLDGLRPLAHLKWSAIYNLHITTKFIGEWRPERLEELKAALARVGKRENVSITIQGLGWFPNPHNPRVFWAGIQGGSALAMLALDIDSAVEPLGIPRETRPFSPHLTLARVKEAAPLQELRQAIAKLESVEFGCFTADRFFLYLSEPGAAGPVYTKVSEYPFQHA
jgi:RNA 2',3'-cyclic 3'-phosphodiesterase